MIISRARVTTTFAILVVVNTALLSFNTFSRFADDGIVFPGDANIVLDLKSSVTHIQKVVQKKHGPTGQLLLTKKSEKQLASNTAATKTKSQETTPVIRAGDVFAPGTLNLTRLETFQRCYINRDLYNPHYEIPGHRMISETHGLVYVQNVKAGSTTSTTKMQQLFNDTKIKTCQWIGNKRDKGHNYTQYASFHWFTFSREPLSRFVSGFQEAMLRWQNPNSPPDPPKELRDFFQKYNKQNLKLTEDHDGVMEALESFVINHLDGSTVPNDHLVLQSSTILRAGCPLRLDAIHEIETINNVFDQFSEERNMMTNNEIMHTRKSSLRLNISMISLPVRQKICQLSALDYCCLNYKLPPECDGVISCKWIDPKNLPHEDIPAPTLRSSINNGLNDTMLLINTVSPYPVLPIASKK